METIKKYFRVERSKIAYLRFIFEAYDGLANITTLDASLGLIVLRIAPDREATAIAVIRDLQNNIMIEPISIESVSIEPVSIKPVANESLLDQRSYSNQHGKGR